MKKALRSAKFFILIISYPFFTADHTKSRSTRETRCSKWRPRLSLERTVVASNSRVVARSSARTGHPWKRRLRQLGRQTSNSASVAEQAAAWCLGFNANPHTAPSPLTGATSGSRRQCERRTPSLRSCSFFFWLSFVLNFPSRWVISCSTAQSTRQRVESEPTACLSDHVLCFRCVVGVCAPSADEKRR